MAKKLPFTYFPLKSHNSTPHLPFWLWSSEGNALDTTITILGGSAPSKRIVAVSILNTQSTNLPSQNPNNRVFPFKGAMPLVDTSIGTCPTHQHHGDKKKKNIDKNKVTIDGNSLPYVTPNQLPLTPGKFLFGRITVIDKKVFDALCSISETFLAFNNLPTM